MMRFSIIPACLLALCSCLVSAPPRANELYVDREYAGALRKAELVLDSLSVQKGFDSKILETNAAYILHLLLERRNQDLPPNGGESLSLHALIKEAEFPRDLQTLNTVTVELRIFDPPRTKAVALALYSETTKETIESYSYLHSVIRRALRQLDR